MTAEPSDTRLLGVIRNPNSLRNRRAPRTASTAACPGVRVIDVEPADAADIPSAIKRLHQQGVMHLAVDGGDGTLRDVLSALAPVYGRQLPRITLLTGGNANLTAADVGSAGHGADAMAALLRAITTPGAGRSVWRSPVQVRWPDNAHAPVWCFFVGAATFHRAWQLAVGGVHRSGFTHGPAVMATIAGAALKSLFGGATNPWRAGAPMGVVADGREQPAGARYLFLATSLRRLIGPVWPFFDDGEAPLRWLDVAAPPPRLALALPALLRGRPSPWMRRSGAYRGGGAQTLHLSLQSPLVLDGEAHAPGPSGCVELAAAPLIEFFSP